MLIIVDRRNNNNNDKMYILYQNDITQFTELYNNYILGMKFIISSTKSVKCYLYYGINEEIRFYPEYLTGLITRFFRRNNKLLNDAQYIKKIYGHNFKYALRVNLKDKIFEKYYKIITKYDHITVNYNRDIVDVDSNNDIIYDDDDMKLTKDCSNKDVIN